MRKRRLREKERYRQEILSAALRLFAEKGYHGTSMQEIAAEADFAVGTLYRFFPSKKALYEALVIEEALRFHQKMMAIFKNLPSDPLKAIRLVLVHRLQLVREHFLFIKMYLTELWEARFRRGFTKELKEFYEEYLEALSGLLENFAPTNAKRLAVLVDAVFSALVCEALEKGKDLPSIEEIMQSLTKPLLGDPSGP